MAGQFEKPVILFSGGKDSVCVLHLARKAFAPAPIPFSLLHVDTGHNFPEVLEFRDRVVREGGYRLQVANVQDWIDDGRLAERPDGTRNPLQTVPLVDTIVAEGFDAVIGGARRDEEKARAKERIFSLRDAFGGWDPRKQRPELWNLFNGKHAPGEHVRVFPLSNWTELDVWNYIEAESIELPDIYYAHDRDVFARSGMWLTPGQWGGPRRGRRAAAQTDSLPHGRRHVVHGGDRFVGRHHRRGHRRDHHHPHHRARRHPGRRQAHRGGHGRPQAGRVFLTMTAFVEAEIASDSAFADFGPGRSARDRDLLRFATAGSVDDGKSTLVGRLLHDSKSVLSDQLDAVERTSTARGLDSPDLSLLVDGLRAEREQGITIDVAYRYFATPARTFILADTPGHVQYTRNTITGASTADLVVLLVDARTGVVSQTRRHAAVAALVGVPHLLLAVNKIDLVDFDEATFDRIAADFDVFCRALGVGEVTAIPVSALLGDNIVARSENMPWYRGPSILEHLETLDLENQRAADAGLRFPVQYVIRPRSAEHPDYRGYAGRVAAGTVRPGDEVVVLPSGRSSTVSGIDTADGPVSTAVAGESVTLLLADDVDIARGDLIAAVGQAPTPVTEFTATVTQLADRGLRPGMRAVLRYGTSAAPVLITALDHRLDIDTLAAAEPPAALALNDIAQIRLRLAAPLPVEDFRPGGAVGSLLLVDPADGTTLAAGMVGDRRAALRPARTSTGVIQKDGSMSTA